MSEVQEVCVGCDAAASQHPIVGIGREGEGSFKAHPVCSLCHVDPSHRKRPLKMHFFPRSQAPQALGQAGSSSIG